MPNTTDVKSVVTSSSDVFTLDKNNPKPFAQPLLVLIFDAHEGWHVDVGGAIDLYLKSFSPAVERYDAMNEEEKLKAGINSLSQVFGEGSNWRSQATPLLEQMIQELCLRCRLEVTRVFVYRGSAGPSHVILNGALFKRLKVGDFHDMLAEKSLSNDNLSVGEFLKRLGL